MGRLRCLHSAARVRLDFLFSMRTRSHGKFVAPGGKASAFFLLLCAIVPVLRAAPRPQQRLSAGQGIVKLEADQQRQVGKKFFADGNVDIVYRDFRLRADHVEFDDETKVAIARGHVQFDRDEQHLDADTATFELRTGHGVFHNVHGSFKTQRRPNINLLVSSNPLLFYAVEVERVDERVYKIRDAWLTVCPPDRPTWKFFTPRATIVIQHEVHLERASFRLFSVPIVYLPYATLPAGRRLRQSGFMTPEVGDSSVKGYFVGDSYYWAPTEWMDSTIGAQLMTLRGWSQNASFRARPDANVRFDASYYGVSDRGIVQNGVRVTQGGHEAHFGLDAFLPGGWRVVADLNELTSLTFRLAFAETFAQAVNSEVRNTAFLTNTFRGFTISFAALSYKNFLSTNDITTGTPETSVVLRTAPEARFMSYDQAPWQKLPIYFSFDLFADGVHRADNVSPSFQTPAIVQRTEFAPSVTMPLHWGPWLSVIPTFTLRSTRYGAQLVNGVLENQPFVRTTEEFSLDLRPPSLAREWGDSNTKWKHSIEPDITYRYVNGVNDYGRFLRYDEDETLTDTSEVEYSLTQRLFRKQGDGDAQDLVTWRISQKYFLDPTFGGALVPGQRNVFQTLDALTPFAFADQARRFSPIISDLRITPGGPYDAQLRVDYDPQRGQITGIGTLLKLKPFRESFLTLADFSTINIPPTSPSNPNIFQPRSNQVRALVGYGDLNRRGWNTAFGMSYDVTQRVFQNQLAQLSYNGSCCGIGFEYRRLTLGNVRSENQYRLVLLIANIGSVGNVRRQDKIF